MTNVHLGNIEKNKGRRRYRRECIKWVERKRLKNQFRGCCLCITIPLLREQYKEPENKGETT